MFLRERELQFKNFGKRERERERERENLCLKFFWERVILGERFEGEEGERESGRDLKNLKGNFVFWSVLAKFQWLFFNNCQSSIGHETPNKLMT